MLVCRMPTHHPDIDVDVCTHVAHVAGVLADALEIAERRRASEAAVRFGKRHRGHQDEGKAGSENARRHCRCALAVGRAVDLVRFG